MLVAGCSGASPALNSGIAHPSRTHAEHRTTAPSPSPSHVKGHPTPPGPTAPHPSINPFSPKASGSPPGT